MGHSFGTFNCITVDMGASSIRVMLGTIDPGGLSILEVHRVANGTIRHEGHDCWDIELITGAIFHGIRKAAEVAGEIPVSIGVDCWGVDFVLLDPEGRLLEPPVAYRDSRTDGMAEVWEREMTGMETFRRTGINFYTFNTLFQLLSLRGSEALKRTTTLLFLPSYINYLLTGIAWNEQTIASTSQMLGVKGDRWDPEIVKALQLSEDQLGRVVPPGTRMGKVHVPETGATEMENVAVCGHDTACVVAAVPAAHPDFAYISAGTWCIVGIESPAPLLSEEAFRSGFTNERGYNNSYRVLKNIVGLWLLQGLRRQLEAGSTYRDMEQMAVDGGETLQLIDPEDPVFYNPTDMRQAFNAYFSKTGQDPPGEFSDYIRCAYQSLCCSFRYHIELLEKISGRKIGVIHLVGGGSQSDYLNTYIARICQRRVYAGPVEGASLGNLLIQAIAMGRLTSLEEGRTLIRRSFPFKDYQPGPGTEAVRKMYERFLTLKNQ